MKHRSFLACLLVVIVLGFVITGCGGKQEIVSDMTGTWKSDKGGDPIKIYFSEKEKSIHIGFKPVPVTVKKVDAGSHRVTVTANPPGGKPSEWSLRQVWNDNGTSFTIDFEHDGVQETLTKEEG